MSNAVTDLLQRDLQRNPLNSKRAIGAFQPHESGKTPTGRRGTPQGFSTARLCYERQGHSVFFCTSLLRAVSTCSLRVLGQLGEDIVPSAGSTSGSQTNSSRVSSSRISRREYNQAPQKHLGSLHPSQSIGHSSLLDDLFSTPSNCTANFRVHTV